MSCLVAFFGIQPFVEQFVKKTQRDVIPKAGGFWRAEESVLFQQGERKSRFLAPTVPRGEAPKTGRAARNDSKNNFPTSC